MIDNKLILFETIFAQSPVSTQIFNPQGDTIMVNKAWEELWQINFKKLKSYNILADQQLVKKGAMTAIKKGFKGNLVNVPAIEYIPEETVDVKGAVPHKWVAAKMFPIKDAKGKIAYIVLQHEDTTSRREKEELNARLAAIVATSDDAIVSKSLDGIIRSWNNSAETLFGYKAEEAIGKHISIIIPKDRLKEEVVIIKKLKRGIPIDHYETIRKRKDGEEFYVSLTISPIIDSSGKIIGASKIARDISQKKRDEEALRKSEERLRIALDAGKIGVWDWNLITDKLTWSERVFEINGVSPDSFQVNIENFRNLIHEEDRKKVKNILAKAINDNVPFNATFRIVAPDGDVRWVETSAAVTRDKKGKPLHMLGATTDTSKEKKVEQDKNDFVGIATHELKTPVTSLKAYAEVLQRRFARGGDMFSSNQLAKMNAQLDKLTMLISDLLDVTKIESGKLRMHYEKFDFDIFVSEVVEELQRTTERHTISIDGQAQKKVTADRERTGQVLTNLISNAIKYSPHTDKILIKVSATDKNVQVCVQDFGVGIPVSKQDKLFERFYRISGPKENTFPGLGLGLYVSHEITKRLNGRLWVESELGKGSTFCFLLPIKAQIKKQKNTLGEEEIRHE
jgi:PAS domain S-box-containing protein